MELMIRESDPLFNGGYTLREPSHDDYRKVISEETILKLAREVMQQHFNDEPRKFDNKMLTSPKLAQQIIATCFPDNLREHFIVMYLDNQHRVIDTECVFSGNIVSSSVYPGVVVRKALEHNSAAIMIAHNHPSGCPDPSQADKRITSRIRDALAIVDLRLLDHFIYAGDEVISFEERGLM